MTVEQLDLLAPGACDVLAQEGRYRASDPETSKKAAQTVKAGTQRFRVLAALCSSPDGLNGWEASVKAGIRRPHAATTRCEELEDLGFAYRTGATRPTDTGCSALVFFASDAGRVEAARLTEGDAR